MQQHQRLGDHVSSGIPVSIYRDAACLTLEHLVALSLAEIGTGIPNPEQRRWDDFRVSLKLDFELLKVPDALFNLFIE